MFETLHSRDVADYFLANVEEDSGDSLSNLKLQKLVYFAQGLYLAMQGAPLFHEPIEAWDHGPVIPDLYHAFKYRGYRAIEPPDHFVADDYAPEVREILDTVLVVYGQFSAWKLRDMTHEQAPWRETLRNSEISHEMLKAFFSAVVEAGRENRAIPGEPVWPTNSFKHQRRREIMSRAPERDRLRAALSRKATSVAGAPDRA
jgi:uncharacterized phage-associated protein